MKLTIECRSKLLNFSLKLLRLVCEVTSSERAFQISGTLQKNEFWNSWFWMFVVGHLESEGRLQVAIDSILLVVLPGAVGEVPTRMIG